MTEPIQDTEGGTIAVTLGTSGLRSLLRGCFDVFHGRFAELSRLSIETSNDLFEMDPVVSQEDVYVFRSRRREWTARFDEALRDLFEQRLAGERRARRRPDGDQSLASLRILTNADTTKQSALAAATRALASAAAAELAALDYRVSVLFEEPPGREVDNPFSPAYLLDAIGMTSRALFAEARIWRPLMVRVVTDLVPAINQTYIQLNRYLAERGVVPEIGAVLRARSNLRPADDGKLLHLFSQLLNEVHPSLQAWRTLDLAVAAAANYQLAPLKVNPYLGAATKVAGRSRRKPVDAGGFPQIEVMMAAPKLASVLETLDCWQRTDPMAVHLRASAADAGAHAQPVNRIPWIHAALAAEIKDETARNTIDVVGFLFDQILQDSSIPPEYRFVFDGLQVPLLKAALVDSEFFADKRHPARRLINDLASAAVGANGDLAYGQAFERRAMAVVDTICADFVLDTEVFARACHDLKSFTDDRSKQAARVMQPRIDAALAQEARDADRSQVRALIRDKLAGRDIPFDVRAFIGTVWAENLTQIRQTATSASDAYAAAVQTMDDLLWSIMVKDRSGQKARLSRMIPALVRSLREGGIAVQVSGEKMKRFLDALYALHIAAIKPLPAGSEGSPGTSGRSPPGAGRIEARNVHDFIADIVLGTWLAFDKDGARVQAQLSWISPLRTRYLFTGRGDVEIMVFSPEELAWEVSAGKATLVLEPVPLFDRAVSVTLDYLAEQKARQAARSPDDSPEAASTRVRDAAVA